MMPKEIFVLWINTNIERIRSDTKFSRILNFTEQEQALKDVIRKMEGAPEESEKEDVRRGEKC